MIRLQWTIVLSLLSISLSNGANEVPCENIGPESWSGLGDLRTCYMNGLTDIDAPDSEISTPKDENLRGLRCNGNRNIDFLPVGVSTKFPNLIGYDASLCSIKTIKKANFRNLNKLKQIYLNGNQIELINSDTFEGLTELGLIYLSNFQIDSAFIVAKNHSTEQITTKSSK